MWHLDEFMPWPLEQIIRQYLGFNEFVVKEYNDNVEYDGCLIDKRTFTRYIIAQWRSSSGIVKCNPYVYQFRFIFKDYNKNTTVFWLEERISKPRCFYKDIVRFSVPVGRVVV